MAASGALSSAFSTGSDGRGTSSRSAFSTSTTCEVGGTSVEVAELGDQLDVVEHLGELAAEALDLLGGQLEAGEAGDMEDLIAAQHRSVILGGCRRRSRAALARPGATAPGVDSSRSVSQLPTQAISAPASASQAP